MSAALAQKYNEIVGGFQNPESSNENEQKEAISPNSAQHNDAEVTSPTKALPLELKYVVQFPDLRGETKVVAMQTYEGRQKYKERDKAYKDFPILHRRKYDTWGDLKSVQLEIQSPLLQEVFKRMGVRFRELNLMSKPIVIPHPYRSLFFLRDDLMKLSKATETPGRTKQEVELLLRFIESEDGLKNTIKKHRELVLEAKAPGKITFELLWTLFPPHQVVYVNTEDIERCYIVEYTSEDEQGDGTRLLSCQVFGGQHNGSRFGIMKENISIPFFPGTVDIHPRNLPLLPLKTFSDLEQLQIRERLIQRGRKYIDLQGAKFSHQSLGPGKIWIDEQEGRKILLSIGERQMSLQGNSRIIVDASAHRRVRNPFIDFVAFNMNRIINADADNASGYQLNSSSNSSSKTSASSSSMAPARMTFPPPAMRRMINLPEWLQDGESKELSELDYLVCPSTIYAFLLEKKLWALVQVDLIDEIEWIENPFSFLEFEQGKKRLIKGLVESFNTDDEFTGFDDIVRGKGKGLIFLLHGDPGLGKTMTAETIAEHTHRPLYHLTTGELSTNVMMMEQQLREIFGLGWRWGAVVLLDEADVLMSKRTLKELERSAIVAVFLRMIEYYQGLLFLTTNRIEEFDPAFHNRIHVTIKYDDLRPQSRNQIWRNLLKKSRGTITLDDSWTDDAYITLSKWKSNGRDIRNLIRTAYGFAKSEKVDLGIKHVVMVLENTLSEKDRRDSGDTICNLQELAATAGEAAQGHIVPNEV